MRKIYEYSTDASFLKLVDNQTMQEQYVKITILNWNEEPIQEIQGLVTGGNLNLDGSSNIRRTCSLSTYIDTSKNADVENIDNLFSINKKMYLEIGRKNTTHKYTQYDIIWFPQGTFVMISPSLSHTTSGVTLSVQLKDKMCLLNGECGGVIPASTQFDSYDTTDEKGKIITKKIPIVEIIKEAVNHFGGEQLGKIIISDIDSRIKMVMKWTGSSPVYLIKDADASYSMATNYAAAAGKEYKMFSYGEDIGYIYSDFYYTDELIGNEGDNVCTILDKIKEYLGNFEYFYDIDGNFRFQEIKNYLNTSQATVDLNEMNNNNYLIDMKNGKTVYNFEGSNLVNSYNNTPQFNMIKNDFVVWGIKKNANDTEVPIRYHLAIDEKPKIGNSYYCFFYEDEDDGLTKAKVPIIYKNYTEIAEETGVEGLFYMAADTNIIYKWDRDNQEYTPINVQLQEITTNDWRTELYLQGTQAEPLAVDSNYYYTELSNEWPKLYDIENGEYYEEVLKTPSDIDYFLDFIDSSAEISKFSISNIGRRSEVINSNDINCIFEPEIPDCVVIEKGQSDTEEKRNECIQKGQNYVQVDSSIFSMLSTGGSSNSAYNKVREMLYEYTSYNNSITIQAVPVFHLEPNTRVGVNDLDSGISGDYMISTISIPLDISGTMSISATKALERL